MSDPLTSLLDSILLSAEHDATLARYFATTSLVCTLWEYMITVDQEITLIWTGNTSYLSVPQFVFRFCRYGLVCSLIYVNAVLVFLPPSMMSELLIYSGEITKQVYRCKSFASILIFCIIMSALGANTYLITQHLRSWDGRTDIFYLLLGSLILTHIPALVLGLIGMKDMYNQTTYVPLVNTCFAFEKSPTLVPTWACVVAFDTLTIVLSIINALDRPRRSNADIMVYLRDDGAPFFLLVFGLRYVGLILLIRQPVTRYYLTVFLAWPMNSMTLSRFILHNEARKKRRRILSRQTNDSTSNNIGGYELPEWH
ncbi:hypothetical protein BDW22DRAFT_1430253 [Trametopsis cervina]|nr:hypothetical protein BDW22DRAFT_1430253 [Trametopsis cervina]